MRLLNGNNYTINEGLSSMQSAECEIVPEGEDTYTIQMPTGHTIRAELQPNQSTTITIRDSSGNQIVDWNSGIFVSCFILGGGAGLLITSYSGNPRMGALAGLAVAAGCNYKFNRSNEDGDTYVPPC